MRQKYITRTFVVRGNHDIEEWYLRQINWDGEKYRPQGTCSIESIMIARLRHLSNSHQVADDLLKRFGLTDAPT
jgi:hypothetical protein